MKKILLIFLFISFPFFIFSTYASAQGTHKCQWLEGANPPQCLPLANCTAGYKPDPSYCDKYVSSKDTCTKAESHDCITSLPLCSEDGIETAIGCIPVLSNDPNAFIGFVLRWAIGIAGGIAFLLILYAGFEIMTSTGNPERLKSGKELLTSALAGLILLIFSVFILRTIGVDILKIPGFGGP